jgi:hypothetical protein
MEKHCFYAKPGGMKREKMDDLVEAQAPTKLTKPAQSKLHCVASAMRPLVPPCTMIMDASGNKPSAALQIWAI